MRRTFASLKFFNFRVWILCSFVVSVGGWMQRVAQDWLVLTQLTDHSGLAVGITTALQFGPFLFFSPFAGLLADRVNRRKLLFCTQAGQGLLALGLGADVLTGSVRLWHVYIFAGLLGVVATMEGPVRQTFVNELVPQNYLTNAVGLNSAAFNSARMVGPGLAGVLIAWIGTGWLFIFNGVSFAATLIGLVVLRASSLFPVPRVERAKGQIRAAVRYVSHRSDLLVVFIIAGVVSCFGLNYQLTSGLMATLAFGKGAGEYGILGSILAIGSITGALLAARRKQPRVRWVIGSAFGFALTSGIAALSPTYLFYALSGILVGFASLTLITAAQSTVQLGTDPSLRGRVMSLYMMVFQGVALFGSPAVGWIGEMWGPRWSVGVGSLTALAVALWALIWTRRHWGVEMHFARTSRPHVSITNAYERGGAAA